MQKMLKNAIVIKIRALLISNKINFNPESNLKAILRENESFQELAFKIFVMYSIFLYQIVNFEQCKKLVKY